MNTIDEIWLVVHTQQHVVQAYRQYYGKIEDVHYACIKCKGKGMY
jgi:hypothetical protein